MFVTHYYPLRPLCNSCDCFLALRRQSVQDYVPAGVSDAGCLMRLFRRFFAKKLIKIMPLN